MGPMRWNEWLLHREGRGSGLFFVDCAGVIRYTYLFFFLIGDGFFLVGE